MKICYTPEMMLAELDVTPDVPLKARLLKQMQGIWATYLLNQVSAWSASQADHQQRRAIPNRVWQRRSALLQDNDQQRARH